MLNFDKARHQLITTQPFYSSLLLNSVVKFVDSIAVHTKYGTFQFPIHTAATDGKTFYFNPEFVDKCTVNQLVGLIAHEVLHKAFLHTLRMHDRERDKWNKATDAVINQILLESGFELPDVDFINVPAFKDKTAEYAYNHWDEEGSDGQGKGEGGGGNAPEHLIQITGMSEDEIAKMERDIAIDVTAAASIAKEAGKLPASIERIVTEYNKPKVNWKDQLRNYVVEVNNTDYTWKRPNKRYIHQDVYLPTLQSFQMGPIVICFDTSGSIYHQPEVVKQFASEVNSIINDLSPTSTDVLYVDTEVAGEDHYDMGEEFEPNLRGGGGTDFITTFEHIEANMQEASVVVFLTDMEVSGLPEDCSIPTIWCIYGNDGSPIPFGDAVHIKDID